MSPMMAAGPRRLVAALLLAASLPAAAPAAAQPDPYAARVARVLKVTPLIDGHNDWAEALADKAKDKRWTLDLTTLPGPSETGYDTDLRRLRAGMLGGQFWSVWVSPDLPPLQQVRDTLDQIDLVRRIAQRYPQTVELARTAADVRRIHRAGRIASLIGVEGGGQLGGDLGVLRAYRELGAGYLTLTHWKTLPWADSATDEPKHDGLTKSGEAVVRELNRLGMLVDLSHVSEATMRDALRVTRAPVIFSHSSARALSDHPRNVPDAVLSQVAANGGVVMVTFVNDFVSDAHRRWKADMKAEAARFWSAPSGGLYVGQPDRAKAAMEAWLGAHPEPRVTLGQVADHIERVARVAGHDHVGLGGDFDGASGDLPEGLKDVASYPALLAELMRRGWSDADVAKLAGGNVLRVMERAEAVAAAMSGEAPTDADLN